MQEPLDIVVVGAGPTGLACAIDAVKTNLRLLSQDERITAIAKMLSGEKPTAAAFENAREMIGN